MELSTLTELRDEVLVFGESELNVTWNPAALTPNMEQKLSSDQVESKHVIDAIIALITKWDLEDGGKPVKLTEKALGDVSILALGAIFSALADSVAETASAEGKDSAATSQPTA